jgi:hypothetical protein
VKRAALLLLVFGAPLLLLAFPGLLRSLARRARLFLVIVSGLTLAAGVTTSFSAGFASRPAGEKALTVAGVAVLAGAWLAVAGAALRAPTRR